jgi:hypothetical protein
VQPPREARRACPDLETIAALVDGTLRGTERTRATEHLAACETCYFVFAQSSRRQPTGDQSVVKPFSKRHSLSLVAVVAAAAAFVFFIPNLPSVWGRSVPRGDLQALVDAVGAQRNIEPRLTGGFSYGRLPAAARNEGSPHLNHSPDVIIAAATIEKRASALTATGGRSALGVAYLVMGQFEKAVPLLEELAESTDPNPAVLSDLAAAYMVRAASKQHSQDFARALARSLSSIFHFRSKLVSHGKSTSRSIRCPVGREKLGIMSAAFELRHKRRPLKMKRGWWSLPHDAPGRRTSWKPYDGGLTRLENGAKSNC